MYLDEVQVNEVISACDERNIWKIHCVVYSKGVLGLLLIDSAQSQREEIEIPSHLNHLPSR